MMSCDTRPLLKPPSLSSARTKLVLLPSETHCRKRATCTPGATDLADAPVADVVETTDVGVPGTDDIGVAGRGCPGPPDRSLSNSLANCETRPLLYPSSFNLWRTAGVESPSSSHCRRRVFCSPCAADLVDMAIDTEDATEVGVPGICDIVVDSLGRPDWSMLDELVIKSSTNLKNYRTLCGCPTKLNRAALKTSESI